MSLANLSQLQNHRLKQKEKALICYFSYTNNTRLVAVRLRDILSNRYLVDLVEIQPSLRRRYFLWLIYSFFPDSRVGIENSNFDVSTYGLICLGVPKWTLSCPPFNEYLHLMTGCSGKKIALFVTFGGFREKGFISRIVRKIREKGAGSVSLLLIKRRNIANGSFAKLVDDFAECLMSNARKP